MQKVQWQILQPIEYSVDTNKKGFSFDDYLRRSDCYWIIIPSQTSSTKKTNKMKSTLSILIVASLASIAFSDSAASNRFVDQVVAALKADKNFDPLHINTIYKTHFSRNIGHLHPIHLEGDIKVHSTVISGLSRVHRVGDAVVGSGAQGNGSFSAKMALGDEEGIKATALVSIHGTHVHPELQVMVTAGRVGVHFDVEANAAGNATLATFVIDKFEQVHFHVVGLFANEPLFEVLADAYVFFFNEHVKKAIADAVKPIIEAELKSHKVGVF